MRVQLPMYLGHVVAAVGLMPVGIARDLWGSYNLILPLVAVIPLVLALATVLFGKKPERFRMKQG